MIQTAPKGLERPGRLARVIVPVLLCGLSCADDVRQPAAHSPDSTYNVDGGDDSSTATVPFEDYLTFAESFCDAPRASEERKQILLSQVGIGGAHAGSVRFLREVGSGFLYITESCELYTPQKCTLNALTNDCPVFYYDSLPYTRTRLTSRELALLLNQIRAFEWGDKISRDQFFRVDRFDSFIQTSFGDTRFMTSVFYKSPEPWDVESPDQDKYGEEGWNVLNDVDFLLHDALSVHRIGRSFGPPLDEIVERAEEHRGEFVRLLVGELDPDATWLDERYTFEWPLSVPPEELRVIPKGGRYCFGESNAISGSDAEALRELVRHAIDEIPRDKRRLVIPVIYDTKVFGLQMRETLPMEGDDGIIDGIWDVHGEPICTYF